MQKNELAVIIGSSDDDLAGQAAADAVKKINGAVASKGVANVVFSAGASQTAFLEALMGHEEAIEWDKVVGFQLDEYVGLAGDDERSKRHYLKENAAKLDGFKAFHFIEADQDVASELKRLDALVQANPIDLAFVGVGEGGALGLNDPPNLEAAEAYVEVELSSACRGHQVSEGGFAEREAVPERAISMSLQQIMKCDRIISVVPGRAKAVAVKNITEGTPSAANPAAFLQRHPDAVVYLDGESASLLRSQIEKNNPGPAAAPAAGRGFVIRTFRPGQGWVEVGQDVQKERSLGTGKLTPMEMRKKKMAQKRLAALKKL